MIGLREFKFYIFAQKSGGWVGVWVGRIIWEWTTEHENTENSLFKKRPFKLIPLELSAGGAQ